MGRKILKSLFWVLILALLVLPMILISQISSAEMAAYTPSDSPEIRQSSVGTPRQATRTNLQLSVTVSGTYTSTEVAFMELDGENADLIRWLVSVGEEVQIGQVLGYCNGQEVISTVEGKLRSISTAADNAYLMVDCFTPVVLECAVSDGTLDQLTQFNGSLALLDGTAVTLVYTATGKNMDGSTTVRLSLDREGDCYGTDDSLTIYLGSGYPNVLVLPLSCVYQKVEGDGEPWYVRQVTEDGILIGEKQVSISYDNGYQVIVSGIEEGQWFDSGYKG